MRGLSLIFAFLIVMFNGPSDSPHGDKLDISCKECHTSEGWEVNRNEISFKHEITNFKLTGLHTDLDCKSCHQSLIFSEAKPDCMSCHTDLHQQTVGFDCIRCHNTNSWIVSNITEIHQISRFPLLGAHNTADCYDCHQSASLLKFEPLGVECIDCHQSNYNATTDPNHAQSGFSTDCADCHKMDAFSWSGSSFTHTFFPLTLGHEINDCSKCHQGTDYSNISPDCVSCHQSDYLSTTSPNHQQADLSTNCVECHTTNPGWRPADFPQHDNVFPIYSGEHNGEWSSCVDCHTNPNSYSEFTCIDCHEHNKNEMDDEHDGIGGYIYSSPACLDCHPTGSEEGSFNHSSSNFPLTGAHTNTECIDCHSNGYAGTPIECYDCHTADFNASINPNHIQIEVSFECKDCHTTDPEWKPATFDIHNDYYTLTGAHLNTDCFSCHEDQYNNTANLCIDCHTQDFNESVNPNHSVLEFANECETCHSTDPDWRPATFDVHNDYYPLTGAHLNTDCFSCHEDQYTNTANMCIDCHNQEFDQSVNPNHTMLEFTNDCETCHSTQPDWQPATFDNHNDYYLLSGAHSSLLNDCFVCHQGNYQNTPNTCFDCHQDDYNQTNDPPHASAQFGTDCLDCHTQFAWEPSTFDHDGDFFPIYSGKHQGEWNTCNECHPNAGDYGIFSCIDCHEHNKPDMDDEHKDENDYVYNSIACLDCHPDGSDKSLMNHIQHKIR